MTTKYTKELYSNYQIAYDFFNEKLFNSELPQALVTLNRKTGLYGYHKKNAFTNNNNENINEIALNPDCFDRPIKEILATLAHEQVHLLCDHRGYVSRKGFHSKQWGGIMLEIGLQPISAKTGEDADSGAKMHHRIIENGLFDKVCDKLLEEITFDIVNILEIKEPKEKKVSKICYICPECNDEVYGKIGKERTIICGECSVQMKPEDE